MNTAGVAMVAVSENFLQIMPNAQISHLLEAVVDLLFLVQVAESPNAPFVPPVESLAAWGMGHAAAI